MFHPFNPKPHAVHSALEFTWLQRARRGLAQILEDRRQRAVAYRELHAIDEHTLRDIGLSHRAAAEWPHVRRDWR